MRSFTGLPLVSPDLLEMSLAERMALEGFETKSANGRPLGPPQFITLDKHSDVP